LCWLLVQPRQGEWPLHLLLEIADRHGRETCVCRRRRCRLVLRRLLSENRQACREKAQRSQDFEAVAHAGKTCSRIKDLQRRLPHFRPRIYLLAHADDSERRTQAWQISLLVRRPDWALTMPFIGPFYHAVY